MAQAQDWAPRLDNPGGGYPCMHCSAGTSGQGGLGDWALDNAAPSGHVAIGWGACCVPHCGSCLQVACRVWSPPCCRCVLHAGGGVTVQQRKSPDMIESKDSTMSSVYPWVTDCN
jgi:hypothetical protein